MSLQVLKEQALKEQALGEQASGEQDEPPPFLKTWTRVYTAVLSCLFAVICLFYAFTRFFS